jgi:predicted nucleic acid-binding protein
MEIVINEWFPEFFIHPEGSKEKNRLRQFVNIFYNSKDVLVIKRPSEFWSKLHRYAKANQNNEEVYKELKTFIRAVLQDSRRVIYIDDEVALPIEIDNLLNIPNTNFSSDQYLFEAAYQSESKIIVTTDQKLIDHMGQSEHYRLIHLDNFIEGILK